MSNRPKRRTARHNATPTFPPTGPPDPAEFARLFRQNCSECGSAVLDWWVGEELKASNPELLALLAPEGAPVEEIACAHVWTCPCCGEAGMFLGLEFG